MPIGTGAAQCLKFGAGTNAGNGNGNGNGNNNNGGGGNNSQPAACGTQPIDDPNGVGPGNYHLLNLGGTGGSVIRQNLAGGFQGCLSLLDSATIDTAPGNKVGPVRQGLNTRFGEYQGGGVSPAAFPPDLVTTSPQTHSEYTNAYANENYTNAGEEFRRIITVPIADCAGIQNGQSNLPVFALGCYFLREKIAQGGQENYVIGELIDDCNANGIPGDTTPALGGPFEIILFNDPGNPAT